VQGSEGSGIEFTLTLLMPLLFSEEIVEPITAADIPLSR